MKKRIDYKEQIKSPKWQKRRLEILNRDNFTCQMCGKTESTLHVHHTIYVPGRDIWDYNDLQLITLCEKCHEEEHKNEEQNRIIKDAIANAKYDGITHFELCVILRWFENGYFEGLISREIDDMEVFFQAGKTRYVKENLERLKRLKARRDKYWNDLYG